MEGVVGPALRWPGLTDLGDARDHRADHGFDFDPRDHLAKALVNAEAEADMAAGLPGHVKAVRIVPAARIAVGCGEEEQDLGALGNGLPRHHDIARGCAEERLHGPTPAQGFLHCPFHQRRIAAQPFPFTGEACEGMDHRGYGIDRGIDPGSQEGTHQPFGFVRAAFAAVSG